MNYRVGFLVVVMGILLAGLAFANKNADFNGDGVVGLDPFWCITV